MARSHLLGRAGEALAADHLRARGWRILAEHFRLGHKEIDLVAARGDVVAFVEVKTRRGTRFGHPLEAVTARKRREIERVAAAWVARKGRTDVVYRFDVIAILWPPQGEPCIQHQENAWMR